MKFEKEIKITLADWIEYFEYSIKTLKMDFIAI